MTENYGLTSSGTYTPDELIAGSHPVVEIPVTIATASTSTLSRGQILGMQTSTNKYCELNTGASDGTESPKAVLARDTNTSSDNAKTTAYVHGEFNANAMSGLGETQAVQNALQALGIYVKEVN